MAFLHSLVLLELPITKTALNFLGISSILRSRKLTETPPTVLFNFLFRQKHTPLPFFKPQAIDSRVTVGEQHLMVCSFLLAN